MDEIKCRLANALDVKLGWCLDHGGQLDIPRTPANRKLVTYCREDMTWLIARVERLEEALKILRSAFKHHDVIGGTLHAKWEAQIIEALAEEDR